MKWIVIWLLISSNVMLCDNTIKHPTVIDTGAQAGFTQSNWMPPESGYKVFDNEKDAMACVTGCLGTYKVVVFKVADIQEVQYEVKEKPVERTVTEIVKEVTFK